MYVNTYRMTIVADVSIPASTIPPGGALRDTETYAEFARRVPVGDEPHQYLRVTRTADLDAFEAAVDDDERVRRFTAVEEATSRPLYRIEWERPPPCSALYRSDLVIERATGTPEEWIFRLRAGSGEALRAVQDDCHKRGVRFEVRRLDRSSPTAVADRYGLTAGQREALVAAFEAGFFEVPREATLDEIGEELGVSGQAASERLRRAEREIIRATVLAESESDPPPG